MGTIAEELALPLKGEYIATRVAFGGGMPLSYIEGHHAIREANRIFGWDGWTRSTDEMQIVQDEQKPGRNAGSLLWYVGYIAKVNITALTDRPVIEASSYSSWATREGYGFGQGIDADRGRAHESAIKEAETDAMKRALMTFGDPLGLALYDKAKEHVENSSAPATETKGAPPAPPRPPSAPADAPPPREGVYVGMLVNKLLERDLKVPDIGLVTGSTVGRDNVLAEVDGWLKNHPQGHLDGMLDEVKFRKSELAKNA